MEDYNNSIKLIICNIEDFSKVLYFFYKYRKLLLRKVVLNLSFNNGLLKYAKLYVYYKI